MAAFVKFKEKKQFLSKKGIVKYGVANKVTDMGLKGHFIEELECYQFREGSIVPVNEVHDVAEKICKHFSGRLPSDRIETLNYYITAANMLNINL